MIGQLHREFLRCGTKYERHRGHYKTLPSPVATFDAGGKEIGIVFQTTSPFDAPRAMNALVAWFPTTDHKLTEGKPGALKLRLTALVQQGSLQPKKAGEQSSLGDTQLAGSSRPR